MDFAKGIKWITGKRNEADATKAFRDYLRLNLRLCNIGHPGQLTDEQVKKLLTPLVDEGAKATEDKQVEDMMTRERKTGFNQVALITTREQLEKYQAGFVRPYRNAEKGKRGGRPRGEKKKSKKPLERKATLEK